MAFQGYRSRSDQTVSSNAGTKRVAHPTAPELEPKSGAENLSPAPVRQYDREAEQAWGRNDDARQNPGGNAYGGPSSLSPGQKAAPATINPMAPKDQVLENVLAVGTAHTAKRGAPNDGHGDDWQTRQLNNTGKEARVPVHSSMHGAAPGGTVPARTGSRADDSAARRAAQLKNGQ